MKYIFVTGGVLSGIGKGIIMSSIGYIMKSIKSISESESESENENKNKNNFDINFKKLDGYLNVDPGLMSPFQHGEVFVTEDGYESDLDLGHYERFTNVNTSKHSNITSGQLYQNLINKERNGDFLGKTVQIFPHLIDEIIDFIERSPTNHTITMCEAGGTVGDHESRDFIEAFRQMRCRTNKTDTLYVHVVYVPWINALGEHKTKPAQHSVQLLSSMGIQPDILICRSERKLDIQIKKKLALFCGVVNDNIIDAVDVSSVYKIPLLLEEQNVSRIILNHFNITDEYTVDLHLMQNVVNNMETVNKTINIAIVGKYFPLDDAYYSLLEALKHASYYYQTKVNIIRINARIVNTDELYDKLKNVNGLVVPGGYGTEGKENKINAIKYARENKIPFLGICLGMQLSAIEFARNVIGMKNANTSEENLKSDSVNIVGLITEWETVMGGTQRLGSYRGKLKKDTIASNLYDTEEFTERHRHRYELNIKYQDLFKSHGMIFSGISIDGKLPEIIELEESIHPYFISCQFHPEYKSRPYEPRPLFKGLINAAITHFHCL